MERLKGIFSYPKKEGIKFDKENPKSKSRTQQHFAKAANINNIMEKYRKTGLLGDPLAVPKRMAMFADVSRVPDFQVMANKTIEINQAFERLPAIVRSRFDNNPELLINFIADDANLEECVKMGLRPKSDLPAVPEVPSVTPPAS